MSVLLSWWVGDDKALELDNILYSIGGDLGSGDLSSAVKGLKRIRAYRPRRHQGIVLQDGSPASSPDEVCERWKRH